MSYYALNDYVSDGKQLTYAINWSGAKPATSELPYLSRDHIKVYEMSPDADNVLRLVNIITYFEFIDALTISLSSAVTSGNTVRLVRETPADYNLTNFSQTLVRASDFELMQRQLMFIAQEDKDKLGLTTPIDVVTAVALDAARAEAAAASIIVATKKFNTYAEQMAYTGDYIDGQKCDVLSYYALGDGGFIPMYWSASSTATHNGGTVRKPTAVSGAGRWIAVNTTVISIKQFGARGDGVNNDYQAVLNAFSYANSLVKTGLVSTIKHIGCTVVLPVGTYYLSGITGEIKIQCNVVNEGAVFVVPAAYAVNVLMVGMDIALDNLAGANIELPAVVKPTGSAIVTGSAAVRIKNVNACKIVLGRTYYFDVGVWLGGIGEGTVYSDIYLSQHGYCKTVILMKPDAGGWCNANRIYGGNTSLTASFAGGSRTTGYSHLVIDGRSPATSVVGNSFFGTSFEGDGAKYYFDIQAGYINNFIGCYMETGVAPTAAAVSGDTITASLHGLAVGDKLTFQASTAPTGMILAAEYFVVSVPTADTFKVALSTTGAAITFTTAGTAVTYIKAIDVIFRQAGGEVCNSNQLINTLLPASLSLNITQTGQALNNTVQNAGLITKEVYSPEDLPIYRGRNTTSSATSRAIFAAYAPTKSPTKSPSEWSTALSDRGVLFGSGAGVELGVIQNASGILKYRTYLDSVSYDLPSATRSASLLNVTALSCAAGARTITTLTLNNVSTNENVMVTPSSALPDGIAIAWCRVSAANTVQVCFYNWTGGVISLTADFQVLSFRRYF